MGKLADLVAKLDRRKAAILQLGESDGVTMVVPIGFEAMLPLFAGTDVDPDELVEGAETIAAATFAALMAGQDPRVSIMAVWIDGLATGLQEYAPDRPERFVVPTKIIQDAWARLTLALLTGAHAAGDLAPAQTMMRTAIEDYPVQELVDEQPSSQELADVAGRHAERALALLQEALGGS